MIQFVTLAQAKSHLYILEDETADDALLEALIAAASGAVRGYLKDALPWQPVLDSNLLPEVDSNGAIVYEVDSNGKAVRAEVQQATLLLVGYFYKNRDDNPDNAFDRGYLPMPVTALLYPLRVPTMA